MTQWDDEISFPAGTAKREPVKAPPEELPRPMPHKTGDKAHDFKIEQLEGIEWSLKKRRK